MLENQQYLYVVQWGKEKSICRFLTSKGKQDNNYYIIDNQTIVNIDETGASIY